MTRKRLTILGATGSIGESTLDVVARHPDRFEVVALSGHSRVERLRDLCLRFRPRYAVVSEAARGPQLQSELREAGSATEVLGGASALEDIASLPEVDAVMAAIVGAAGLRASLAAARAGKTVLLANKEALVVAGGLFMEEVRKHRAHLLPIDSEHNAVFQSLPRDYDGDPARAGVRRIVLTASGGPFRETPADALAEVTPDQACAHPNWVMGRKISVDSATMMNKGLEVIEAHWLFSAEPGRIEVVIHPQSVLHSMVEYLDGSVIAQLGNPDMRTPIAHALAFPERVEAGVSPLDLTRVGPLTFEAPDERRFPCLSLAYSALRAGGGASVTLNAANEVAVEAFLDERLRFDQIAGVISDLLCGAPSKSPTTLAEIIEIDARARCLAQERIRRGRLGGP